MENLGKEFVREAGEMAPETINGRQFDASIDTSTTITRARRAEEMAPENY
jgi:hypothetical protein